MDIGISINPALARILKEADHRQWLTVKQQRLLDRLMSQADRVWWNSLSSEQIHIVLYGEVNGRILGMQIEQLGVNVYMEILVPADICSWLERLHQIMESNQS